MSRFPQSLPPRSTATRWTVTNGDGDCEPPGNAGLPGRVVPADRRLFVQRRLSFTEDRGHTESHGSAPSALLRSIRPAKQTTVQVTVLGLKPGKATITLTGQDSDGNRVSDSFTVTVRSNVNTAPRAIRSMDDISGLTEQTTRRALLSDAFRDADNDPLTISASSSNSAVARVSVDRNYYGLTFSAVSAGTATITVTATDDRGGSASNTFAVTVVAPPPQTEPQTETQGSAPGEEQDVVTLTLADPIKLGAAYVASAR